MRNCASEIYSHCVFLRNGAFSAISESMSDFSPDLLADHLFVMGFSNDPVGALSDVMRARIDTAARLHRRSPHVKVIVTGGHGDNFNRAPLPGR